MFHFCLHSKRI